MNVQGHDNAPESAAGSHASEADAQAARPAAVRAVELLSEHFCAPTDEPLSGEEVSTLYTGSLQAMAAELNAAAAISARVGSFSARELIYACASGAAAIVAYRDGWMCLHTTRRGAVVATTISSPPLSNSIFIAAALLRSAAR